MFESLLTYEKSESPKISQEDIDAIDGNSDFKSVSRTITGAVYLRNKDEQIDVVQEREMIEAYKARLVEILFPQGWIDTLPKGVTYEPYIHPALRKCEATVRCKYQKDGVEREVEVFAKGYRKEGKGGWLEYNDFKSGDYDTDDVVPFPADATLNEVRDIVKKMICELFPQAEPA